MAKRRQQLLIPGLYGDLVVKLVTRKTLLKHLGERPKKDAVINGAYFDTTHTIYIASELEGHARVSTLMHELQHHTLDSTASMDEEARCDVLGAYMLRALTSTELQSVIAELSKHE